MNSTDFTPSRGLERARRSSACCAGGGRVLDVDVGHHAAAHLVGRAGGGLDDRDEHAEHERGEQHGEQRGEAGAELRRRPRSASLRKKRGAHQLGWPSSPTPSSPRRRTANSVVDSSGLVEARQLVADDAALAQLHHAAAHLVDHLAVVGGDDDGRAGAVDPVDQLHDPDRGLGVEVAGGLVGQQQRRVVDEGAGDRHALLLAARQLVGVVVELGGEADEAQDVRHLAPDLLARLADHLERVGHVVVDRAVREQLVVLEDHADVAAQVGHALARHVREARPAISDARPRWARAPS